MPPLSTLVEMVEARAREQPDQVAYTYVDFAGDEVVERTLTFKEVCNESKRLAAHLQQTGLRPGERVLILSTQTPDNTLSLFGALFAGLVFTIIPPPIDDESRFRFRAFLEHFRPKRILTNALIEDRLKRNVLEQAKMDFPKILARFVPRRISDAPVPAWLRALPEHSLHRTTRFLAGVNLGRFARFLHAPSKDSSKKSSASPLSRLEDCAATLIWKRKFGLEIVNIEDNAEDPYGWSRPSVSGDTIAYVQYSSGSTSAPKGVLISHANVLHNVWAINRHKPHTPEMPMFGWVPLFHNIGLVVHQFFTMYTGCNSIIMSPLALRQAPMRWFRVMDRYRVAVTTGSHSAYVQCAGLTKREQLRGLDLSPLTTAVNGSEPVDYRSLTEVAEKLAPARFKLQAFKPGYGLSEATCAVSFQPARENLRTACVGLDDLKENRFVAAPASSTRSRTLVASGKVLPGMRIVAMDPETLRPAPLNGIGELWVQGPSVAGGYLAAENETRATFGHAVPGIEGQFLRTGDLGYVDTRGYVFVTGRLKDVIILDGKNYYSNDIESSLKRKSPDLADYAIVSFSLAGGYREKLVCCMEIPPGISPDFYDFPALARHVSGLMVSGYHWAPYEVAFTRSGGLPRTANQKIAVSRCKRMYEDGTLEFLYRTRTPTKG